VGQHTRGNLEYLPNTTCLPSRKSHLLQVMKNWQPFVSFPLFAWQSTQYKWHINNLFVEQPKMISGPTKGGKLLNVITHKVMWANQKTESYVCICWNNGRHFKCSVDALISVTLINWLPGIDSLFDLTLFSTLFLDCVKAVSPHNQH